MKVPPDGGRDAAAHGGVDFGPGSPLCHHVIPCPLCPLAVFSNDSFKFLYFFLKKYCCVSTNPGTPAAQRVSAFPDGNMWKMCFGGSSRAQLAAESSPGCYRGTPQICQDLSRVESTQWIGTCLDHDSWFIVINMWLIYTLNLHSI